MDDDELTRRFDFIEDWRGHYAERLAALEQEQQDREEQEAEERKARPHNFINWAVLALFVVECSVGIVQLMWSFRHG